MNKKAIIAAVVVIVVLVVGVAVYNSNKQKSQVANNPTNTGQNSALNPADNQEVEATEPSTTPTAANGTTKKAPVPNEAYTKAIALYGSKGYRIQFSQCHGNPGSLSLKKGVQFMLDNRDDSAHTIVIKSQTFHIPAYGFTIATAKDLGTYNITCDGGGAAQLNVEG